MTGLFSVSVFLSKFKDCLPVFRSLKNACAFAPCAFLIFSLAMTGCSGEEPTYEVTGKVVFADNQEPVPGGVTIVLESTRPPHERSSADIQRDGTFTLSSRRQGDGSIEGTHRVRFTAPVSQGAPDPDVTVARILDQKYTEFATSGLTVEVEPDGDNELLVTVERAQGGGKAPAQPAPAPALPPSQDPEAIRSPDLDVQ